MQSGMLPNMEEVKRLRWAPRETLVGPEGIDHTSGRSCSWFECFALLYVVFPHTGAVYVVVCGCENESMEARQDEFCILREWSSHAAAGTPFLSSSTSRTHAGPGCHERIALQQLQLCARTLVRDCAPRSLDCTAAYRLFVVRIGSLGLRRQST